MTNGMKPATDEYAQRRLRKINRKILWEGRIAKVKRKILFPFIRMLPAQETVWIETYGGRYPACPHCGEMVYYRNMCCFCGQRFKGYPETIGGVLDELK